MVPAKVVAGLHGSADGRDDAHAALTRADRRNTTGHVMTLDSDYVERRLVEESSKLRLETAELRTEIRGEFGAIRIDLAAMRADIAVMRADVAANKFELLKWVFGFWVAQLVGVAGIMSLLLRTIAPR
jgi:hypothetical protein